MDVAFNPRENGACPLCRRVGACVIRKKIADSLADMPSKEEARMEIVVYACPRFVETA